MSADETAPSGNLPPLVLDIDGTLTTPNGSVDPRTFEVLSNWPAPVVLATGKAFPYPVALCHFIGIPEYVIAENGGVLLANEEMRVEADPDRVRAAVDDFKSRGGSLGWGPTDTVNRWRETEVAVHLDADEPLLQEVAEEYGLELVDTGYAYHLKPPGISKGLALESVSEILDRSPSEFVAIGDSENDASTFEVVGDSFAVANADAAARTAASHVLKAGYMDGTIEALDRLRTR